MAFLTCCIIILVLFDVGAGFSACPSDDMVEERMEATETVRESIIIIFSNVLNTSSVNGTGGNSSLTNMEVYERIATSVNATVSPSGFVRFEEAVSEIAAATYSACSGPEESRVQPEDIPQLAERFFNLTSTGNISQAREVYGKLLCLQMLLTEESHVRKKRQFKTDIELIYDFFDMLEGHPEIVSSLFGLTDDQFFGLPPTLAFVVDDTGSMSGEISAVQRLIFSFLSVERTNPIAYILTTFNDPGIVILYVCMFIIKYTVVIVGIDKECMECNIFVRLETHLTIGFNQKTDLNALVKQYNNAVRLVNKAKSRLFRSILNLKILKIT